MDEHSLVGELQIDNRKQNMTGTMFYDVYDAQLLWVCFKCYFN